MSRYIDDDDIMTRAEADEALALYYLTGDGGGGYVESSPFIRGGSKFSEVLGKLGKVALPIVKSAGKYLGNSALNLLANTGSDVISGKNVGESIRNNLAIEAENTKYDIAQRMRGVKRKKTQKTRRKAKAVRKKKSASVGGGAPLW